jgi:hypothetical protein
MDAKQTAMMRTGVCALAGVRWAFTAWRGRRSSPARGLSELAVGKL